MKKITTAIILLATLTTGYAQLPNGADAVTATAEYTSTHPSYPYGIRINAVRNFYDQYGDANNETWYATDYGFRAKFGQDGIAFMADYNKKGGWISTIKTYAENKLPKYIREKIRREYYDYHIFLVKEIDQTREAVYFVSIEDTRSWMILRLAGDEMETVAAFEK